MAKRILVVEDDPNVRAFAIAALSSAGVELELLEASDGVEAEGIVDFAPVDLVITDLKMPEMNGVDLAVKLREKHPDTRVVLMSGASSDFQAELELHRLLDLPLLPKPISVSQLVELAKSLLDS